MGLREVLEVVAAAIIAVVMFFSGRGCSNEESFTGTGQSFEAGTGQGADQTEDLVPADKEGE